MATRKQRYRPKDRFYHRAKKEGFAARSVYKLEELDQRFQLIKKGARVVDLGCAPGSWLQYLDKTVGPKGLVLGYDLAPVRLTLGEHVRFFERDIFELTAEEILEDAGRGPPVFDVFLSDLAPKTTGIRDADQARSIDLVEHALALGCTLLKDDGVFAAKVFQGRGFDELMNRIRGIFKQSRALRPKATRQGSREAFIMAKGRRPATSEDEA